MPEKIKIGVVGCGVGRSWVSGAALCEDTIAWAVADLDQKLARQVAEERVYKDYRELLMMKLMPLGLQPHLIYVSRW